uniref:AP2/ERF domain-containing protein n=1 Tax=Kalanchoe fedtschenkoi TaxID=63787 RepID=A0A7N0ZZ98_KALFE
MVSVRKAWRKLMGLSPGQSSFGGPLAETSSKGNKTDLPPLVSKPISMRTILPGVEQTTKDDFKPISNHFSGSSTTKEQPGRPISEFKRRKRHRRKQIQDQETCLMRGVYFKNMKWQAAIKVDKKQIHLGTVGTQEEAAHLYDRAAFMCGREPNFELSEEEKQELKRLNWDEFLTMTRSTITNKKHQRRRLVTSRLRSVLSSQLCSDTDVGQGVQSSTPSDEKGLDT